MTDIQNQLSINELVNIYFDSENRKGIYRSIMNAAKKAENDNIIAFCAMKKNHFSDENILKSFFEYTYKNKFLPSEIIFEINDDNKVRFNVKFTTKL